VADVLKYNGESVILPELLETRNLVMGEKFDLTVLSSLYGARPLKDGVLLWYAKDQSGNMLAKCSIVVEDIQNGQVETLGNIKFTIPKFDNAFKMTVFAHLSGGEYEIDNDWDFWVFPEITSIELVGSADSKIENRFGNLINGLEPFDKNATKKPRLVAGIDMATLDFLKHGGRVLLLGSGGFPVRRTKFQIASAGRPKQNLATVIKDHPVFYIFPHEGFCDWQFKAMLDGGQAVDFTHLDLPFNPVLEMVNSYKVILKQAAIFEFSVGQGKLLVCTLNIEPSNPAAVFLFHEMLNYVSSEEFAPKSKTSVEEIKKAIVLEIQKNQ